LRPREIPEIVNGRSERTPQLGQEWALERIFVQFPWRFVRHPYEQVDFSGENRRTFRKKLAFFFRNVVNSVDQRIY